MSLEIIINQKVKNPPSKWKKWDRVYAIVDFFGVKEVCFKVINAQFVIKEILIKKEENGYMLNLQSENNDFINFKFNLSRIQNLKPLLYNGLLDEYEVG